MQVLRCIFCGFESVTLVSSGHVERIYCCSTCRGVFVIQKGADTHYLLSDGGILGTGTGEVAALLGLDDEAQVVALFEGENPQQETGGDSSAMNSSDRISDSWCPRSGEVFEYGELSDGSDVTAPIGTGSESLLHDGGRHVLANSIPDSAYFIAHVSDYVGQLTDLLHGSPERFEYTQAEVEWIDSAIGDDYHLWLQGDRFRGLVAYVGEAIRIQIGGRWISRYDPETAFHEPLIVGDDGSIYNPWIYLYTCLSETRGWCLISAVSYEIRKSPKRDSFDGDW